MDCFVDKVYAYKFDQNPIKILVEHEFRYPLSIDTSLNEIWSENDSGLVCDLMRTRPFYEEMQ